MTSASLENLALAHVPLLPDLYLPFDQCEDSIYNTSGATAKKQIQDKKARRMQRKQKFLERTEALEMTNDLHSGSLNASTSQNLEISSAAALKMLSPKPRRSEDTRQGSSAEKHRRESQQMQVKQYEGHQAAQTSSNFVRNPFKRQLTDKYSAEKLNAVKESRLGGGADSRMDSAERDKTGLSLPSDLSQVAANA